MYLHLKFILISWVFCGRTARSGQIANHNYFQSRALQEHIEGHIGSVQNSGMLTEYKRYKICVFEVLMMQLHHLIFVTNCHLQNGVTMDHIARILNAKIINVKIIRIDAG